MTITSFNAKSKLSGRSSGVERNLAKVEVVSSNLIARSNFLNRLEEIPCALVDVGAPIGHPVGNGICSRLFSGIANNRAINCLLSRCTNFPYLNIPT